MTSHCRRPLMHRETQNINKSLLSLGDVIHAALEQQQQPAHAVTKHIPYRNSKLTFFLQDSLGGNSKTLMIVQASPNASDVEETLSTLTFGQRVSKVKLKCAGATVLPSDTNENRVPTTLPTTMSAPVVCAPAAAAAAAASSSSSSILPPALSTRSSTLGSRRRVR